MNLSELTTLLTDVSFLEVKGKKIIERRTNANRDKPQLLSMTFVKLRAIDPRLPAAIEGQLLVAKEIMKDEHQKVIWGNLLRRTLQIWQNEQMLQTKEAGPVAYDIIGEFEKVDLEKKNPEVQMTLYGNRVRDFISTEGVSIKLSERTLKETFTLCPDWLEDNYPGWQNRYVIASALGYEEKELANFVLSKSMALLNTPESMDKITFD